VIFPDFFKNMIVLKFPSNFFLLRKQNVKERFRRAGIKRRRLSFFPAQKSKTKVFIFLSRFFLKLFQLVDEKIIQLSFLPGFNAFLNIKNLTEEILFVAARINLVL
jgi:hypothetical protein